MPGAGRRIVRWRSRLVAIFLGDVGGLERVLGEIDGAAGLEEQLEFGFAGKVAVILGANLAANKVGAKDWLLHLNLVRCKGSYQALMYF